MKKKLIILAVVLISILGIWYFYQGRSKIKIISSSTVQQREIRQTLILSGEVDALEHVDLRFQSAGMLSWVGVKEGDTVNKYQAIAGLDKNSLKKSLEQKLNTYMTYRWNFEQTQDDNEDWQTRGMNQDERDAIKRIVEKSQFGLNNAVLDVELQDLAIKFSTLTTPIAGRVIRAEPKFPGVNISPSTSTFEIVNPSTIYFSVAADQTEVVNFKSGQPVSITLDSFPDKILDGHLTYVSYTPDPTESGTVYKVRVESLELTSNNQIRMGMTGDAEFILAQKEQALQIPNQYVQSDSDGNSYVWTNNGKTKTEIKIGIEGDEYTEIVNGLELGQQVYLLEQ